MNMHIRMQQMLYNVNIFVENIWFEFIVYLVDWLAYAREPNLSRA